MDDLVRECLSGRRGMPEVQVAIDSHFAGLVTGANAEGARLRLYQLLLV